jgi:hypothetical protein
MLNSAVHKDKGLTAHIYLFIIYSFIYSFIYSKADYVAMLPATQSVQLRAATLQ